MTVQKLTERGPVRILVCGGRDYADREAVFDRLDIAWRSVPLDTLEIVQGGAKGADALAREWCGIRGVPYINVSADWHALGKKAGPIRNQKMIDLYHPALVIAFPGGHGTADMVRRASNAGIPVEHAGRAALKEGR